MYSIHVFLKDETSIELLIGSAFFLGLIYQPARELHLQVLSNFWEDNDLTCEIDFMSFIQEMGAVVDYWNNEENMLRGFGLSPILRDELNVFYKQIKEISVSDILRISIF